MSMKRREFIAGSLALPFTWTSAYGYEIPLKTLMTKTEEFLRRVRGGQVAFVGETRNPEQEQITPVGSRWVFTTPTKIDVKGPDGQSARVQLLPRPLSIGVTPDSAGQVGGNDPQILPPSFMRLVFDSLFRLGQVEPLIQNLKVNLTARRLALFGQQPVQVLGAANTRDLRGGQIWIHQDTFNVARVIGNWGGRQYDLRLEKWRGPITDGYFPHRILLLTNGRWSRRLHTEAIRRTPQR